jgi:hypothetical protein
MIYWAGNVVAAADVGASCTRIGRDDRATPPHDGVNEMAASSSPDSGCAVASMVCATIRVLPRKESPRINPTPTPNPKIVTAAFMIVLIARLTNRI